MTQEERWQKRYEEVEDFIEENKRNPSKHRIEEHDMLNWVKQQRKLVNAGKLKAERMEAFKRLMEIWEENKRKNQWE
jgi:putative ribosome biogenesis GTPase RsgA